LGRWIATALASAPSDARRRRARLWLVLGLALNLGLLGYFKYANFFVDNLNLALGGEWSIGRVILPIGISFYTFTTNRLPRRHFPASGERVQVHPLRALRHLLFRTLSQGRSCITRK
jgi:D-alanyl-lipoteichoic acid acyltransferase DltB (MBOAT superfamily)